METEHIVKSYDDELGKLDNMIAEMGGLAEAQLAAAIQAMANRDVELAERIIQEDKRIDEMENEIDNFTLRLFALRQPMAEDLRIVIAALKVSANLERIGDYAKNIAKRTVPLSQATVLGGARRTITRMGALVQGMIKNVLDAYVSRDSKKADDVRLRDEEVDTMYTSLFRELLTYMMEDPRSITSCTHLLFVAKNVERIGDHATSIAEQVHFIVRGERPEDERPKRDLSSLTVISPDDSPGVK